MGGQACVFYGAAQFSSEVRVEQAKDRAFWAPLKAEFEAFRRAEREGR